MGTSTKGLSYTEIDAPAQASSTGTNVFCLSVANNKLFFVNLTCSAYSTTNAYINCTENLSSWYNFSIGTWQFRSGTPRVKVTYDYALKKYLINGYLWGSCTTSNGWTWNGTSVTQQLMCWCDGYWFGLNASATSSGIVTWSPDGSNLLTCTLGYGQYSYVPVELYYHEDLILVLGHVNNNSSISSLACYKNPANYSGTPIFSSNGWQASLGAIGYFCDAKYFKGQYILGSSGGYVVPFNWETQTFGTAVKLGSGGETHLACSDNLILACNPDGTCYYSEDGISWNQVEVPNYPYQRIAYYLDTFVLLNSAVATAGKLVLVR